LAWGHLSHSTPYTDLFRVLRPQLLGLAARLRDDADLAGFVQPLEDGVDDRQLVRIRRQVDADREQAVAHFGGRHRHAGADREPDGVGDAQGDGGREPDQPRERADRLRELREPLVECAARLAERLVLFRGRLERGPVLRRRHTRIYTLCINARQVGSPGSGHQSARSAWMTSTRDARAAGISDASTAAATSTAAAAT